jgi:molybdopterin converting factor small subunit
MAKAKFCALLILTYVIPAMGDPPATFEQNYLRLQKKIEALKDKGEKVGEDTRKEIDALMVQMNHEHAQLKHELEVKNQQVNQKIEETKKREEDWSKRVGGAVQELGAGMKRAWNKLSKGEP